MEYLPWYLFSGVWLGWLLIIAGALLVVYLVWRRRRGPTADKKQNLFYFSIAAVLGAGVTFGLLWLLGERAITYTSQIEYDDKNNCYPKDAWGGWFFLGSLSPLAQERLLGNYTSQLHFHCEQTKARVEAWVNLQERRGQCKHSAMMLTTLGRFEEAISAGERCADPESLRFVAYARTSLGDFTGAANTLRKSAPHPGYSSVDLSIALLAKDKELLGSLLKSQIAWLEKTKKETEDPSNMLYGKVTPGRYAAQLRNHRCLSDALGLRANDQSAKVRLEAALKEEDADRARDGYYGEPVCRLLLSDLLSGQERLTMIFPKTGNSDNRLFCLLALEVDPAHSCAAAFVLHDPTRSFFSEGAINQEMAFVSTILVSLEGKELTPPTATLRATLSLEAGAFELLTNHPESAAKLLSQAEGEPSLAPLLAERRALLALRLGKGVKEAAAALPAGFLRQQLETYADVKEGRASASATQILWGDLISPDVPSEDERQALFGYIAAKDGVSLANWLTYHRVFNSLLLLLALPELDAPGKEAMREWFRWSRGAGIALEHNPWRGLISEIVLNAHEVAIWKSLGAEEAQSRSEATERFYKAYFTRELAVPLALLSGSDF